MKKLVIVFMMCTLLASAAVSINSASKLELISLDGIGEKTALAIIEYRSKHKFKLLQELMKIKGIGHKKYEKLKKYIEL